MLRQDRRQESRFLECRSELPGGDQHIHQRQPRHSITRVRSHHVAGETFRRIQLSILQIELRKLKRRSDFCGGKPLHFSEFFSSRFIVAKRPIRRGEPVVGGDEPRVGPYQSLQQIAGLRQLAPGEPCTVPSAG